MNRGESGLEVGQIRDDQSLTQETDRRPGEGGTKSRDSKKN